MYEVVGSALVGMKMSALAPMDADAVPTLTLPETCIRRPVMTTLLMMAFVIFGLFSYRLLPVAALPRVDFPTIVVTANLPGASPESMASSVATPLERQFSNIAGLSSVTSTSGQGVTSITLQFDLDRNIDGAALDVQSALTTARNEPDQVELLSGVFEDKTLGTPITAMVRNVDQRSQDYDALKSEDRLTVL